MNFQEAESYLFSLGNEVETMKLGLENITALLAAVDDPQKKYPKVQVAGTNGKGSVCAFLESICSRAGIRTGLYTSPHLVSIRERIRIAGEDIAEDEFARLASLVKGTAESLVRDQKLERVPTFFEQITAIALLAFAEGGVELAILETGLGGRYDATTAARAEVAGITRIDLDHQQYLGETIEEIAAEKAAIIRPDSRVVLMRQERRVEQVLVGRCREVGVEPVWSARVTAVKQETGTPGMEGYLIADFATESREYRNVLFLYMFGRHQIENAAVAVSIGETLVSMGFEVDDAAIEYGLGNARNPGRLEYIDNILLDGAHNPGSAAALRDYLDDFVDKPITLVFGAMRDKDVQTIAEILWPRAEHIILTKPANSRAMRPEELASLGAGLVDPSRVVSVGTAVEAIAEAKRISRDGLIVVTGSLYLVGEVRSLLK